jgi:uncharacterized RDD family membrane protein YckC
MTISSAEKTSAAVPAKRETIVDFSAIELQAPLALRIGSMMIDYMVFLVLPVGSLLYYNLLGERVTTMTDRTLWFVSIILFLTNIIVLPLITGRSLGKLVTGLRVVRSDGTIPGFFNVLLRQTLGYLITAATLGLGFVWCVFSSKGRTLHDVLTGTIVVRGRRRVV